MYLLLLFSLYYIVIIYFKKSAYMKLCENIQKHSFFSNNLYTYPFL